MMSTVMGTNRKADIELLIDSGGVHEDAERSGGPVPCHQGAGLTLSAAHVVQGGENHHHGKGQNHAREKGDCGHLKYVHVNTPA